jgi:hypothetical protein
MVTRKAVLHDILRFRDAAEHAVADTEKHWPVHLEAHRVGRGVGGHHAQSIP